MLLKMTDLCHCLKMSRFQSYFLDSTIDFILKFGKAAFPIESVGMCLLHLFLLSKMFLIPCTPEGKRPWM